MLTKLAAILIQVLPFASCIKYDYDKQGTDWIGGCTASNQSPIHLIQEKAEKRKMDIRAHSFLNYDQVTVEKRD